MHPDLPIYHADALSITVHTIPSIHFSNIAYSDCWFKIQALSRRGLCTRYFACMAWPGTWLLSVSELPKLLSCIPLAQAKPHLVDTPTLKMLQKLLSRASHVSLNLYTFNMPSCQS